MRRTVAMAAALLWAGTAQAQDAVGQWHGVLEVGENRLRVSVVIEAAGDGALIGRLVSVDQTPMPVPLEKIVVSGETLSFESTRLQARFDGRWDQQAQAWNGTFTQGGALPLTLNKGPVPPRARPQTPKPPFPYVEEQVAFEGPPGVKLGGTLTLPTGAGPFPVVVMITGSGQQDRDETLFDHKPFAVIADALTRRGVAVLRYDDRGVGQSTGPVGTATSEDFAGDVRAAMAFLRTRQEIDPERIGLIGHSEGASIAPMVAAADPRTAFIVLMAPPGVPGPQAIAAQRQALLKARGAGPDVIARNEVTMGAFDKAMAEAPDLASAQADAARIAADAPTLQARAQMRSLASAWYYWFMRYDPAPTLQAVKVPVLALFGSNDLQAPPDPNLIAVRAALKNNARAEVVELPGLNHLFQTSATGDPRAYARIEETLAPAALNRMVEWVERQAKAKSGSLR